MTTLKIILAPFYTWKCTNIFINHIMFDSNILIWIAVFITMHSTFLDIIFNRFYDYHYASGNITDFRFMLRHYLLCLNLCDTLDWKITLNSIAMILRENEFKINEIFWQLSNFYLHSLFLHFTCIIKWWHYHGTKKVLQYFSMIKSNIYLANVPIVIENWHILTFVLFFQYCYLTIHCLRGKQSFESIANVNAKFQIPSRYFYLYQTTSVDDKRTLLWHFVIHNNVMWHLIFLYFSLWYFLPSFFRNSTSNIPFL